MLLTRFELNFESKNKRASKFARLVKRRFFEQNLTTIDGLYIFNSRVVSKREKTDSRLNNKI